MVPKAALSKIVRLERGHLGKIGQGQLGSWQQVAPVWQRAGEPLEGTGRKLVGLGLEEGVVEVRQTGAGVGRLVEVGQLVGVEVWELVAL